MDVANPERVWVEGRCYRKNPTRNNYGLLNPSAVPDAVASASSRVLPSSKATATAPYKEHDDMAGCKG